MTVKNEVGLVAATEWKIILRSREEAIRKLLLRESRIDDLLKHARKHPGQDRRTLVLWIYKHWPETRSDWVKSYAKKALDELDRSFLRELGNVVRTAKTPTLDRLRWTIVMFWTEKLHSLPPLCFFSDQALIDLLKIFNCACTLDQFRKIRGRELKLVKCKKSLIRHVENVEGKWIRLR